MIPLSFSPQQPMAISSPLAQLGELPLPSLSNSPLLACEFSISEEPWGFRDEPDCFMPSSMNLEAVHPFSFVPNSSFTSSSSQSSTQYPASFTINPISSSSSSSLAAHLDPVERIIAISKNSGVAPGDPCFPQVLMDTLFKETASSSSLMQTNPLPVKNPPAKGIKRKQEIHSNPKASSSSSLIKLSQTYISQSSGKKYVSKRLLGKGSTGVVVEVINIRSNSPSALKIHKDPVSMRAETSILRKLHGIRHTLMIKDEIQPDRRQQYPGGGIVIPYLAASDCFTQFLGREETLCFEHLISIAQQCLECLADLHAKNLVHGDLKPANMSFDPETTIFNLLDFSLGDELISIDPQGKLSPKDPTQLIQALAFRSPEILEDQIWKFQNPKNWAGFSYNHAVDLWGLACCIYEFYVGKPLLYSELQEIKNLEQAKKRFQFIKNKIYNGNRTWMAEMRRVALKKGESARIEELIDLVKQMLKVNPKDRISAAAALKHRVFDHNIKFHITNHAREDIQIKLFKTKPKDMLEKPLFDLTVSPTNSVSANACYHIPKTEDNRYFLQKYSAAHDGALEEVVELVNSCTLSL